MPFPRDRLDLYCCQNEIEGTTTREAYQSLVDKWKAAGIIDASNTSNDDRLIKGGFERLWLDTPGKVVLYANNQGGFRVRCKACNNPIAREFSAALTRWRQQNGPRSLVCQSCKTDQILEEAQCNPPIRFASGAIVFSGVNSIDMTEEALAGLTETLGPFTVVMSRKA